jgi:hypothetical protein
VAGPRFGKAETGVRSAVAAPRTHSWRNGRRSRLRSGRPRGMEVQVLPGAPDSLRQAAKASVLHTDIPRFESWGEHHTRFVSLVAKAPARHAGDPRFESATRHQILSRSSKAEHPADNRKTADRYRAGEPATGEQHDDDDQKTGTAAAVSPSPMDPERSSPRRLGNGLLIRAPRGSTPPGFSITHD